MIRTKLDCDSIADQNTSRLGDRIVYPRTGSMAALHLGCQLHSWTLVRGQTSPRRTAGKNARIRTLLAMECNFESFDRRNDQIERDRRGGAKSCKRTFDD